MYILNLFSHDYSSRDSYKQMNIYCVFMCIHVIRSPALANAAIVIMYFHLHLRAVNLKMSI